MRWGNSRTVLGTQHSWLLVEVSGAASLSGSHGTSLRPVAGWLLETERLTVEEFLPCVGGIQFIPDSHPSLSPAGVKPAGKWL